MERDQANAITEVLYELFRKRARETADRRPQTGDRGPQTQDPKANRTLSEAVCEQAWVLERFLGGGEALRRLKQGTWDESAQKCASWHMQDVLHGRCSEPGPTLELLIK
jgi:hypothetical protein